MDKHHLSYCAGFKWEGTGSKETSPCPYKSTLMLPDYSQRFVCTLCLDAAYARFWKIESKEPKPRGRPRELPPKKLEDRLPDLEDTENTDTEDNLS